MNVVAERSTNKQNQPCTVETGYTVFIRCWSIRGHRVCPDEVVRAVSNRRTRELHAPATHVHRSYAFFGRVVDAQNTCTPHTITTSPVLFVCRAGVAAARRAPGDRQQRASREKRGFRAVFPRGGLEAVARAYRLLSSDLVPGRETKRQKQKGPYARDLR